MPAKDAIDPGSMPPVAVTLKPISANVPTASSDDDDQPVPTASTSAVLWKMIWVAETCFRTMERAHVLADVAAGQEYDDGLPVRKLLRRVG